MALDLGTLPPSASYVLRRVSRASDLTPVLGGPVFRQARLGDKWALDVSVERVALGACAARLVARLARGARELVSITVPQPDRSFPPFGRTCLVNGAGQAGTSLVVDGGAANWLCQEGDMVSILTGGRRYLHQIAAEARFSSSGTATLSLAEMLRVSPADNAVVTLAEPVIEGWLEAPQSWRVDRWGPRDIAFSIIERA